MSMTSIEPKRTGVEILREHLDRAGLSQRKAAQALHIEDRTMRRYCSGTLEIPYPVLMAAAQLPQLDRAWQVMKMLDSVQLSISDGPKVAPQN